MAEENEDKAKRFMVAGDKITVESMVQLFEKMMSRKATPQEVQQIREEWESDDE